MTTTILERVDLEEALLGALLADGAALHLAQMENLTADMFYIARHGMVYAVMLALEARGDGIDLATVSEELRQRGQYHEVQSGDMLLAKVMHPDRLPALPSIRTYAADIRKAHERRQWRAMLSEMNRAICDPALSETAIHGKLSKMVEAARPYAPNAAFTFGMDSISAYDAMVEAARAQSVRFGVPWQTLTTYRGSFGPGDLVGIIGPTGSGKSACLYTVSEYYASTEGKRTAYIFTEMTLKKVLDRRMAKQSGLNIRRLLNNCELNDGEEARKLAADAAFYDWAHKLDYWHAADVTDDQLFATMTRMVQDLGTQVFVIDYINDIRVTVAKGENITNAYRDFLVRLEAFSNKYGVLVWTAAQRNDTDGKAYGIGQAFKQKVSLGLEIKPEPLQSPFTYTFMDLTYTYNAGTNHPITPVRIFKNRDGQIGTFNLLFVGPRYWFVDVPSGMGEPPINLRSGQTFASATEPTDPPPLLLGGDA